MVLNPPSAVFFSSPGEDSHVSIHYRLCVRWAGLPVCLGLGLCCRGEALACVNALWGIAPTRFVCLFTCLLSSAGLFVRLCVSPCRRGSALRPRPVCPAASPQKWHRFGAFGRGLHGCFMISVNILSYGTVDASPVLVRVAAEPPDWCPIKWAYFWFKDLWPSGVSIVIFFATNGKLELHYTTQNTYLQIALALASPFKKNQLAFLVAFNKFQRSFICSGSRRDFKTNERRHVDVWACRTARRQNVWLPVNHLVLFTLLLG